GGGGRVGRGGPPPPIWSGPSGLAHGPAVQLPVTSLPMKNRRLRAAHPATIIVFDVPSVIDANVRPAGTIAPFTSRVCPSTPMNAGSAVDTNGASWALTNGFGQFRSVVAA